MEREVSIGTHVYRGWTVFLVDRRRAQGDYIMRNPKTNEEYIFEGFGYTGPLRRATDKVA